MEAILFSGKIKIFFIAGIFILLFFVFVYTLGMTIQSERLKESIFIIASEEILRFTQEYDHPYGIVALTDVCISPDRSYADLHVDGQESWKDLPKFLTPLATPIHLRISRELGLRKTPRIRFRKAKPQEQKKDILTTIRELDEQYGLSQ